MLKVTNFKRERKKKSERDGGGWAGIKILEREENSTILAEGLKARSCHLVTSCAMAGANNRKLIPKIQL